MSTFICRRPATDTFNVGVRDYVLELVRQNYRDFGPTLASEALLERHGIEVSRETLRKWMSEAGLWLSRKQRRTFHQPRLRRESYGQLIQIEGSQHRWFEDRAESCTLLVFIDDATSKLMQLRVVPSESMSWNVAVRCIALGLSVLSAGRALAAVEHPVCRQTGPSTCVLSYSLTAPSKSVKISPTTDRTGKSRQVSVATTSKSTLTVTAGKPGQRMYFFLTPDVGGPREVSIRHLELEGTPNFRDLGGYATGNGQFVRWGVLYRSGVLGNLSVADLNYQSQLGVHVVCDFRTPDENVSSPERWIEDVDVLHVNYSIGGSDGQNTQAVMQELMASNPTPEQLRARMISSYGTFATEYAPAYAAAFNQLKQDHLPLLYHCTAGKDRTGVFTAFVLLTLGVPQSTVLDDYALTNGYLAAPAGRAAGAKTSAAVKSLLAQSTPEQRKVMMAADPAYLRSTLKSIDSQYGSFANYRRTMLKVSDEDRDRLRAELLTTY